MNDRSLKIRVGALVVVAVAVLTVFVVLLGGFSVGKKKQLFLEFTDSGSLLSGAPVKVAGVRAGRVTDVEFLVERDARKSAPRRAREAPVNVRVTLSVDAKMAQAIRQDSEFIVTTQGVLGEKYIEILPGSAASPEWPDGAVIRGSDPPRIDLLFTRIDGILAQVEVALGGSDLNVGELVSSATRVMKRIDAYLEKHQERLDRVMESVDGATTDARALLAGLRNGVGDGSDVAAILADARSVAATVAKDIGPTTAAARGALKNADETLTVARNLLKRNEKSLDDTLARLPAVAASVDEATRDAAFLARRLKGGKGTIGQLLVDQELYDDLKEMLRDLKRHPWKMLWRE
ncbi:MAG: MCE family protein [Myxococcales bacterium]|nr:MCE family protein [Myxococcales bacterium]MCB9548441.1 MCE family protein [Myxococcales bacterium]